MYSNKTPNADVPWTPNADVPWREIILGKIYDPSLTKKDVWVFVFFR